ncbi:MAG: hypothetical protein ACE5HE_09020 [Phycisphaerae bacterium]
MSSSSEPSLALPVARTRGVLRGFMWGAPAVLVLVSLRSVWGRLNFVPTAFSNRSVDYSIAVFVLPVLLIALLCGVRALRWFLLAIWPGRLGMRAGADALILCLGPFGTRRYVGEQLEIRYPFEIAESDGGENRCEAYLPEEEQRSRLLPRIVDVDSRQAVDQLILRFVEGTEAELAAALRPFIDRLRDGSSPTHQGGQPCDDRGRL